MNIETKRVVEKVRGKKANGKFQPLVWILFLLFSYGFSSTKLGIMLILVLCNSKRRGNRMYVVRYYMTCPCFSLILWRYSFLNRYYMTCPLHSSSFMGWFSIWNTCICCVCMCPIGVYLGKEFYINELVLIFWFTSLFE